MRRALLGAALAVVVAACASGGSTRVTAGTGSGGPDSASPGVGESSADAGSPAAVGADQPIVNKGPGGWSRGPYDLAGGSYRLAWESDGTCSALYFGIVGVKNGFRESPPTAGDVALRDMLKGSRTIADVPAGSYYFNVSNVACKGYSATLTRLP